jgi:hydrogenase expression/formation protein HypE
MIKQSVPDAAQPTRRRPPQFTATHIDMSHGAGGKATHKLIEGLLLPLLENPALAPLSDAAIVPLGDLQLALTTDSFVVRPLRFPGGSIGELAVNGTINDLAVSGATPLCLSAALILEEGLDTEILRREIQAMADAASRAGVAIATGDTKVVERGKGDELYIITTGLGIHDPELDLSPASVRPGDKILCSGTIGDHGVAIMIARGDLDLEAEILSDTQPLHTLVQTLKEGVGPSLRFMRDPTRGGIGTVLNELARDSLDASSGARYGVEIWEDALPIREVVIGACELLGIDPIYVANEGKLLAVVSPESAGDALAALQSVPGGEDASIIGEIAQEPPGMVLMRTQFGGTRMVDMLIGDPLPRIC